MLTRLKGIFILGHGGNLGQTLTHVMDSKAFTMHTNVNVHLW